jgi:hypothetical protein
MSFISVVLPACRAARAANCLVCRPAFTLESLSEY